MHDPRTDQEVRRPARRRRRQHDGAARRGVRLPRPQRRGKTTTLRMMLGLVRPTSGSARPSWADRRARRRVTARVGALIEGPGFYPYLVRPRQPAGAGALPRPAGRRRSTRRWSGSTWPTAAATGSRSYSLGMKQRLGVAAALLGDPELIVLDEPTNGLDPAGMADMRRADRRPRPRRPDRAAVQPPARRGAGDLRPGRASSTAAGCCASRRWPSCAAAASLRVRGDPLDRALAVAMRVAGDDAVRAGRRPACVVDLGRRRAPGWSARWSPTGSTSTRCDGRTNPGGGLLRDDRRDELEAV